MGQDETVKFEWTWMGGLFLALGLTIGLLAGLSLTSTSNTVIQLLASVVAGGGGAYFLLKTNAYTFPLVKTISQLGLILLGGFWLGFTVIELVQRSQLRQMDLVVKANAGVQVLVSEIEAHARQLGVPEHQLEKQVREALKGSDGKNCNHSVGVNPEFLDQVKKIATQHESCGAPKQFVVDWIATASSIITGHRAVEEKTRIGAGLEYSTLQKSLHSSIQSELFDFDLCEIDGEKVATRPTAVESKIVKHLNQCVFSPLAELAASYRYSATQVSARWENPTPTKKPRFSYESRR